MRTDVGEYEVQGKIRWMQPPETLFEGTCIHNRKKELLNTKIYMPSSIDI